LYKLLTKSIPELEGSLNLEGISAETKIFRNEYGIPHIVADNNSDLMFALGYATAQDRLWQMDIQRRIGEGKLSEIFGEETIDIDALMLTIGFRRMAENLEKNLSNESRRMLQSYTDGINAYIKNNRNKLQIEFDILQYEPEPWEIKHSLIILRLFAWQMNQGWRSDLISSEIISKIGAGKAADILSGTIYSQEIYFSQQKSIAKDIADISASIEKKSGLSNFSMGNAWVISGEKSANKHPIIANDIHLFYSAPSAWYQTSLHSPDMDVTGLSIPGIPGILIGHNGKTAWGFTNGLIDDCDFYSETLDSLGLNKYLYQNSWNNLTIITEKIKIKNSSPVDYTVYMTNNGPVISAFREARAIYDYRKLNHRLKEMVPPKEKQVSMRWCGFETSDEILGLFLLNKSKSIIEIEEALKAIKSPSMNFVFCDKENIGQKLCGLAPIREKTPLNSVFSGGVTATQWKGFVNYSELPHFVNPLEKIIVSANSKSNSLSNISSFWDNPSRHNRISEQLNSKNNFTIEDFQKLQTDKISTEARILLPVFINVLEKQNSKDFYFSEALTYLKNWDCSIDKSSISATILNTFSYHLLKNILTDDLGDTLLEQYFSLPTAPGTALLKIISENKTAWFDDVNTPGKLETMDEIIIKSMIESIEFLKKSLTTETKNWRWSELHSLTIKHPLSSSRPLEKIFNLGPFGTDGSNTTIALGAFDYRIPFMDILGPVARFTCDMSNPQYSYSVISTGSSGQPFSRFYSDQTKLLLEGKNIILGNSTFEIESSNFKKLIIRPDF